jgi:hypothetical protein
MIAWAISTPRASHPVTPKGGDQSIHSCCVLDPLNVGSAQYHPGVLYLTLISLNEHTCLNSFGIVFKQNADPPR